MALARGTVKKISKAKFGFCFLLDNNDLFFDTKYEPKFSEGDEVGVTYTAKKNGTGAQVTKVDLLSKGAPQAKAAAGGGESSGRRNESIVWQHSQEMAIQTVAIIAGLQKVKSQEAVDALISDYTVRYYRDAVDPSKSGAFKAAADVDADTEIVEEEPEQKEEEATDDVDWSKV